MHCLQLVLQSCLEHGDHQTAAAVAAVLLKAQVCVSPFMTCCHMYRCKNPPQSFHSWDINACTAWAGGLPERQSVGCEHPGQGG